MAAERGRLDAIRAEWPSRLLDAERDAANWRRALVLFERDDYHAMMECATLFATALARSLYGDGILDGDDLPETVHKALYCSVSPA